MDGIIPLFKPKGPTSHDCVFKLRKMLGQKKVGHTGTLDPEVEGVLPICLGEGTKVIPFLSDHVKEYIADIYLGKSTTTEDASGETLEEDYSEAMPSKKEIDRVLTTFTGSIKQVPPMYSAVKIKGKKLYEYARQGIVVDRPAREILIHDIEQLEKVDENNRISIRVVCSKGTYIRTLCVDIGKALGCPAHMSSLVRTQSDGISLQETVDFATLETCILQNDVKKYLLPLEKVLTHMDAMEINDALAKRVTYGQKFSLPEKKLTTDPFKMVHKGKLLAVYETQDYFIKPVRVFNLNKSDGE